MEKIMYKCRTPEFRHLEYEKQKIKKNNKCIECSNPKGLHGLRCQSCQAKIRSKLYPLPNRKGKQMHLIGKSNHKWKWNDVGYYALHSWLNRIFVKIGICKKCGKRYKTKWANISGEYKREISDWHELCTSCNGTDGVSVHERFKNL